MIAYPATQVWTLLAQVGMVAGLAAQYLSRIAPPLAFLWWVPLVIGGLGIIRLCAKFTLREFRISSKYALFLACAAINLAVQIWLFESEIGGFTPEDSNGRYYFSDHGKRYREIGLEEYRAAYAIHVGLFAAGGVILCAFVIVACRVCEESRD